MPVIFLTVLMILLFPVLVRYKTKQQTNIYIHNKINKPKKKIPWMLLNCKESYLRECLCQYLAFGRSVVALSCLRSAISYFALLWRGIGKW